MIAHTTHPAKRKQDAIIDKRTDFFDEIFNIKPPPFDFILHPDFAFVNRNLSKNDKNFMLLILAKESIIKMR